MALPPSGAALVGRAAAVSQLSTDSFCISQSQQAFTQILRPSKNRKYSAAAPAVVLYTSATTGHAGVESGLYLRTGMEIDVNGTGTCTYCSSADPAESSGTPSFELYAPAGAGVGVGVGGCARGRSAPSIAYQHGSMATMATMATVATSLSLPLSASLPLSESLCLSLPLSLSLSLSCAVCGVVALVPCVLSYSRTVQRLSIQRVWVCRFQHAWLRCARCIVKFTHCIACRTRN